jgi:hypothetical protein
VPSDRNRFKFQGATKGRASEIFAAGARFCSSAVGEASFSAVSPPKGRRRGQRRSMPRSRQFRSPAGTEPRLPINGPSLVARIQRRRFASVRSQRPQVRTPSGAPFFDHSGNRALLAARADAWVSISCHDVSETDASYVLIRIVIGFGPAASPAVVPHAVLRRRTDRALMFSSKHSRLRVPNSGTIQGFRARSHRRWRESWLPT